MEQGNQSWDDVHHNIRLLFETEEGMFWEDEADQLTVVDCI